MSRTTCTYCRDWLCAPEEKETDSCEKCEEQVKKMDEPTVQWLMKVIDGRIAEHEKAYVHEYYSEY